MAASKHLWWNWGWMVKTLKTWWNWGCSQAFVKSLGKIPWGFRCPIDCRIWRETPRRFTSGAALLCLLPFVLSLWFNAATALESPRAVAESMTSHWVFSAAQLVGLQEMGVSSSSWAIQNGGFLWGKIPPRNGWWLRVPLFQETTKWWI